jgi:hypothetical protein
MEDCFGNPLRQILRESAVVGRSQELVVLPPLKLQTNVYDHQYINTVNVVEVYLGMSVQVSYKDERELTESIDLACRQMEEVITKNTRDKLTPLMYDLLYNYNTREYGERLRTILAQM